MLGNEAIENQIEKIENEIQAQSNSIEIVDEFKKLKKLIDEIEYEEDLHGLFKYKYHIKMYSYYRSIGKEEVANKQLDISKRFEKYLLKAESEKQKNDNEPKEVANKESSNLDFEIVINALNRFLKEAELDENRLFSDSFLGVYKSKVIELIESKPLTFDEYLKMAIKESEVTSSTDEIELIVSMKGYSSNLITASLRELQIEIYEALSRIKVEFMKNTLKSDNPDIILFNVEMIDETINKQYKKLSLHFHPDKIKIPCVYLNVAIDFFCRVKETRMKLIKLHSRIDIKEYLDEGNHYWTLAQDYKKVLKKEFDKLSFLKKDDVFELKEELIMDERKNCLRMAFIKYKAALKQATDVSSVRDQLDIRGYIAIVAYELADDLLVAQLYALSALRVVIKYSNLFTEKDLHKAKKIYDKLTKEKGKDEDNKVGVTKSDSKEISSSLSYVSRQKMENEISDHLNETFGKLIIKSDREIAKCQTNNEEILKAKLHGKRKMAQGYALLSMGGVVSTVGLSTVVMATSIISPILLVGNFVYLGASVLTGSYLIQKGTKIIEEPKIRENLNYILQQALSYFDKGKHEEFLKELCKPFTEGESLLALQNLNEINCKQIMKTLLYNGFRPDGVAYLLNSVAETLISGKVSLKNLSSDDLRNHALIIFDAVLNENLITEAEALDKRIKELRLNNLLSFNIKCRIRDIKLNRDYTSIAQAHFNDSKTMPFRSRLEELRIIARLNKAILRIFKNKDDEIRMAEEEIKKVRDSLDDNPQFVGNANMRFDAVEDFFWIITGRRIEVRQANKSVCAIAQDEKKVSLKYLNEQLRVVRSDLERADIYLKKAKYFEKEALSCQKTNKMESLKNWKQALKNNDEALMINKSNKVAGIGRAKCLLNLSKFINAIDYLNANQHLSDSPEFWYVCSVAYMKTLDYDNAQHSITQALTDSGIVQDENFKKQQRVLERVKKNTSETKLNDYKNLNLKPETSKERKTYNVLSIDGGGVRGIIPALWLCEIEKQTKRPISKLFNLMAGTSVGSIIVASLAKPKDPNTHTEYSPYDVVNLFKENSDKIFSQNIKGVLDWILGTTLTSNKYTEKGRKNVLQRYLRDVSMKEALVELVIPAVNQMDINLTHLFNRYDVREGRVKDVSLVDAVMSSTAAPTFFPIHEIQGLGHFLDGGIHLNNPAMTAYTEALRYNENLSKDDIFVLSLGTGSYIVDPFDVNICQGQLYWAANFSDVSLAAQEWNVDRDMCQILGSKYERWQVSLGTPIALDEYDKLNYLSELASQYIEELYVSEDNRMNKLIEQLTKED